MASFLYSPPLHLSNLVPIFPYGNLPARTILSPQCPLGRRRVFFRKSLDQSKIRALREWQDYEEAVKEKDLARALRLLQDISIKLQDSSIQSTGSVGLGGGGFGSFELQRDWDVLDACLNADDMRLVGNAYVFLKDRGRLPSFGKCRNIVLEGSRDITPIVLKSATGLEGALLEKE